MNTRMYIVALGFFYLGVGSSFAKGTSQTITNNGLEVRAELSYINEQTFALRIGARNIGNAPVTVASGVSGKNEKQVDQKMIWLGYVMADADLFDDCEFYKPSRVELSALELDIGQAMLLSTNRIVYSSVEARPASLKVLYSVDEDLKAFFGDIWTGEVAFEFDLGAN